MLKEEGLEEGGGGAEVAVMVEVGGVSCSRSFLSCFIGGVPGVDVGFIVSTGCMLKQEIIQTSNQSKVYIVYIPCTQSGYTLTPKREKHAPQYKLTTLPHTV